MSSMSGGVVPNRIWAGALVAAGCLFVWLIDHELAKGEFSPKLVIIAPCLLFMGLAGLMEPKLVNPWHATFEGQPGMGTLKAMSIAVIAISVGVGFYFAFGLEHGWPMPDFILDRIGQARPPNRP